MNGTSGAQLANLGEPGNEHKIFAGNMMGTEHLEVLGAEDNIKMGLKTNKMFWVATDSAGS